MRRIMLLVLLALTLPTAAFANPIIFVTEVFVSGTVSANKLGDFSPGNFHVIVRGFESDHHLRSLITITLGTSDLTPGCNPTDFATASCTFSSGTVIVRSATGARLFKGSLSSGEISLNRRSDFNSAVILASLVGEPPMSFTDFVVFFQRGKKRLTSGSAGVGIGLPLPEPRTLGLLELGLLGNGLLALVGIARRKLKLGR